MDKDDGLNFTHIYGRRYVREFEGLYALWDLKMDVEFVSKTLVEIIRKDINNALDQIHNTCTKA